MYTHPHISSQIGRERQRDKLARAQQQRLARQLRTLSGAARQANRPARRLGGALRPAGLRTVVARMTGQLASAGEHRTAPPAARSAYHGGAPHAATHPESQATAERPVAIGG